MNTEPEKKPRVTHSYKTLWEKQKKLTRFWQIVAAGLAGIVVLLIIL